MAGDISWHSLNGDNLKIDDDDYTGFCSQYQTIAENAADCWNGFIDICLRLKGDTMKGEFANKVNEIARTYGQGPGNNFVAAVNTVASDMNGYITDMDSADAKMY